MTYRERRIAKAQRLRDWAAKREEKADAAYNAARGVSEQIPFGQPILVGHHSEKRHRRMLSSIDSNMGKSIEHRNKAEEMQRRADNIEAAAKRAIYSDDEDAIQRLEKQITAQEARRDELKAINASARKIGHLDTGDTEKLSGEMLDALISWRKYAGGVDARPVPSYVFSNLSGNINRIKKRLAFLQRKQEAA
jgi:predicted RNase H-like nuclease (RuvC/YqgF family)